MKFLRSVLSLIVGYSRPLIQYVLRPQPKDVPLKMGQKLIVFNDRLFIYYLTFCKKTCSCLRDTDCITLTWTNSVYTSFSTLWFVTRTWRLGESRLYHVICPSHFHLLPQFTCHSSFLFPHKSVTEIFTTTFVVQSSLRNGSCSVHFAASFVTNINIIPSLSPVFDWQLDLLTTYMSQLQVTTTLSLIHTLYNSLQFSLLCLH
jgi:hypothetical protein